MEMIRGSSTDWGGAEGEGAQVQNRSGHDDLFMLRVPKQLGPTQPEQLGPKP